jgi:spermidine synthase
VDRWLLLVSLFVAGAAVMALELLGVRLLAPRFGASTYVWGSLLGTIMGALAVGYMLGGRLADRQPRAVWVHGFVLAASLYLILVLLLAAPVLDLCGKLGAVSGPLAATILLFGPPQILLGSVSPFVVRLLSEAGWIGTTAGRVFALSTCGSLAGTFLTAFWLIPSFGSRTTLRLWIAALLLSSVAGLVVQSRAALRLLATGLVLLVPDAARDPLVLFRGESAYNTVIVEERGGARRLLLNDERFGIHSVRFPDRILTGLYYDAFYVGPILAGGKDVLILGMAGGTTASGYRRLFPGIRLTAVEIDPLIVEVAKAYFGVSTGPDLQVRVADARPFLADGTSRFDVIEADLFAGGLYAPFYVITKEFFELARTRLRPNGVIVVNVLALGGDGSLAGAVAATMAQVFPSVFELPLRNQRLLFGLLQPVDVEVLRSRLDGNEVADLAEVSRAIRSRLRSAMHGTDDPILTDDHAPIERLTDDMVKRTR